MAETAAEPGGIVEPGLWIVATPIGNLRDITLRALDVLRVADVVAAEDTRRTRRLLAAHGIGLAGRRLVSCNDHNAAERLPALLATLEAGGTVALVSDAGTPLLADPGHAVVRAAIAAGHRVRTAPGPSALLAALAVSGLPSDRVLFAGFPPARAAARDRTLAELVREGFTLVLYESPHRVAATVAALARLAGANREAALCRELTKTFEEVRRGPLGTLAASLAAEPPPKGEIVLVLAPAPARAASPEPAPERAEALLRSALATLSVKDAVRQVAAETGLPRRDLYARALRLARG